MFKKIWNWLRVWLKEEECAQFLIYEFNRKAPQGERPHEEQFLDRVS